MSNTLIDELVEGQEAGADLSAALLAVADAGEKLLNSGLTKRAIALLIKDQLSGVGLREIMLILNAVPGIRRYIIDPSGKERDDG